MFYIARAIGLSLAFVLGEALENGSSASTRPEAHFSAGFHNWKAMECLLWRLGKLVSCLGLEIINLWPMHMTHAFVCMQILFLQGALSIFLIQHFLQHISHRGMTSLSNIHQDSRWSQTTFCIRENPITYKQIGHFPPKYSNIGFVFANYSQKL